MIDVRIEICREGAVMPKYAKAGDVGADIIAIEDQWIECWQTVAINTGLKVAIPNGYEIQIRPKSGLTLKTPLRVHLGTIDAGYRGEIGIIVTNENCDREILIKKGQKIAQMVLNEAPRMNFIKIDNIKKIGGDRGGGFGSTGIYAE